MATKSLFLGLAALSFAASSLTFAQAQDVLSAEELERCEELLASLDPSAEPSEEQALCIALLAQLGVQPALGEEDEDDRGEGNEGSPT